MLVIVIVIASPGRVAALIAKYEPETNLWLTKSILMYM
jgi:hypothetical protein